MCLYDHDVVDVLFAIQRAFYVRAFCMGTFVRILHVISNARSQVECARV